jgi:hypothetical protein
MRITSIIILILIKIMVSYYAVLILILVGIIIRDFYDIYALHTLSGQCPRAVPSTSGVLKLTISAYVTKLKLTAAFDALYHLVCRVTLDGGLHRGPGLKFVTANPSLQSLLQTLLKSSKSSKSSKQQLILLIRKKRKSWHASGHPCYFLRSINSVQIISYILPSPSLPGASALSPSARFGTGLLRCVPSQLALMQGEACPPFRSALA